jgi:sortase A
MKRLSLLLIISGICLFGYGGYQWFQTERAQNTSLKEAQALLNNKNSIAPAETEKTVQSFAPGMGDTVGILSIPKLASDLPIVEGTDEDDLEKGVGHYKGTAYPEQGNQIVLSGHRDTVFRRMGELELGDVMTVQLPYGEYAYKIVNTEIVKANDRTVISPTAPDEILTVTTCYPFSYIGNAPDRYIITAVPIVEK